MKKFLKILPLVALSALGMVSCSSGKAKEKATIDYGSYLVSEVTRITYNDLALKMEDGDSFLVALYMTTTCSCWTNFQYVLNQYIKAHHVPVYYLCMDDLANEEDLGFTVITSGTSRVSISVIDEGKISTQWVKQTKKGSDDFNKRFEDLGEFEKAIGEVAYLPNYYYVSESWLDENLPTMDEAIVHFARSGCADCNYASPNAYLPLGKGKDYRNKVYILDFQEFYDQYKGTEEYQAFKDKWELSEAGNETFGYGTGVVPTSHYYENGTLKDATVFFNDTISEEDGKYIVTDSFYSESRRSVLGYADKVGKNVLVGTEVPASDVTVYEEMDYIAWNKDKATEYHLPLLQAFLETYAY